MNQVLTLGYIPRSRQPRERSSSMGLLQTAMASSLRASLPWLSLCTLHAAPLLSLPDFTKKQCHERSWSNKWQVLHSSGVHHASPCYVKGCPTRNHASAGKHLETTLHLKSPWILGNLSTRHLPRVPKPKTVTGRVSGWHISTWVRHRGKNAESTA